MIDMDGTPQVTSDLEDEVASRNGWMRGAWLCKPKWCMAV